MKKIFIVLMLLMVFYISPNITKANHYNNYESFNLLTGKRLENYTTSELNKAYKDVDKRKFSGWKTKIIGNRLKATFINETIFTYYNDGYTPIEYSYKAEESKTEKVSYSSTGSIGVNLSHNKGFKGGLDSSLKINSSNDQTTVKKETYTVKLMVDPGTQINLYTYGEGYLSNGVAAKYLFWIKTNRGGFEYFEVSTMYYKLEKVKI